MKNSNIYFLIILVNFLFFSTLYLVLSYRDKYQTNNSTRQVCIALFTPTTHAALEEIEQGFKETLQALASDPSTYRFTTYNAQGNKTLLRAQAEEIVSGAYDLVFTIGASCSQTIAELLNKQNITMPHVFCAVDGPEFAQELTSLNASSTGVYVKQDYRYEMEIIHKLMPHVKNILLVYDPTHGSALEKDKKEIEAKLNLYTITLHSVEVYQTNEIQQKVAALLPDMDLVLVLTDNTVVAGIDALVVLCNRYGIPLFASDLSSSKKGAALAYGITEYESGSGAAQQADMLLRQGKKPSDLLTHAVTGFRITVNDEAMHAQRVQIDYEVLKQYTGAGIC